MPQAVKPGLFRLDFESPGRTFYRSGDKFSGSVQLAADKPCRLAGLTVTAVGLARVEHSGRRRRTQEEEYLEYQEEMNLEEQLETDSAGGFLLPPGRTFSFWFCFLLSGGLVSSFKGKFGCVRYYVQATLRRTSQPDLLCEREFEVEELLDVNRLDLQTPVHASAQKKVTCMMVPEGDVSISAEVNRKGYCAGEVIHIDANFQNSCSTLVVPKAALYAKHSFMADGRTTTVLKKLTAARGNVVFCGTCGVWQGAPLKIPQVQPSLQNSRIIQLEYILKVYLKIPGRKKLVLELPLVLGNVPYNGQSSSYVGSCFLLGPEGSSTPLLYDYDGGELDEMSTR